MSAFKESERLKQVFSKAAGGSFSAVYRAMRECAWKANSSLLNEADVLAEIAAIRLAVGDRVVIADLPSGLAEGLPEEEAQFLSGVVGLEAEVSDRIDAETLEVSIDDPKTGSVHFITLPKGMISKKFDPR